MNKVKLCAVDAVFNNEGDVVDELNDFLKEHPFGPYDHLSEASREMQKLRKKGKTEKADMLKALLQQFAASQGANANAFEQVPALMKLMRQRNKFAHPYDNAYLVSEMEKGNPDLSSVSDVLALLAEWDRSKAILHGSFAAAAVAAAATDPGVGGVAAVPQVDAAAVEQFRSATEQLHRRLATELLGLEDPAPPPPELSSSGPAAGAVVALVDGGAAGAAAATDAAAAAADATVKLRNVVRGSLHLAFLVGSMPGPLALRLASPGDQAATAAATTAEAAAAAAAAGAAACVLVVTKEWYRWEEGGGAAAGDGGGCDQRPKRIAHAMRRLYRCAPDPPLIGERLAGAGSGGGAAAAAAAGRKRSREAADDDGGEGAGGGRVEEVVEAGPVGREAHSVMWVISPGLVRREWAAGTAGGDNAGGSSAGVVVEVPVAPVVVVGC